MPKKRGDKLLEEALRALSDALTNARVPWMLIGGLAVVARGVRRMTTDIDAVVQGDSATAEKLLSLLAPCGIVPRTSDAAGFAAQNLVLLVMHEPTGVELDISLGFTQFERDALASSQLVRFAGLDLPVAMAEDLVVFKAIAARPKDIEDASTLLLLYDDIDLNRVSRAVHELALLAEEPALEQGLAEIVATTRALRKKR